jgi:hypothetical protein
MPLPVAGFLIPAICGALVTVVSSLVGRVILALGMGVFSYTGINASLDIFKGYFQSSMGSAGANLAGICGVLQLDVVMSIFIAAGLARLVIVGATSGTIKRLAMK